MKATLGDVGNVKEDTYLEDKNNVETNY